MFLSAIAHVHIYYLTVASLHFTCHKYVVTIVFGFFPDEIFINIKKGLAFEVGKPGQPAGEKRP